jgi:hypothetical protein
MAHSRPYRLPGVLVAGAAASVLMAAPALATEGPAAPPPGPQLPSGVAAPTFSLPTTSAPPASSKAPRIMRNARLLNTRVKQGRRGKLRISLNSPSRLRIVLTRVKNGHRIKAINVAPGGNTLTVRLPARRKNGHDLRVGRYSVSVSAVDANGVASSPIKRTMKVHG